MICLSITEHLERRKQCPKACGLVDPKAGGSDGPNTARNVSENNVLQHLVFTPFADLKFSH